MYLTNLTPRQCVVLTLKPIYDLDLRHWSTFYCRRSPQPCTYDRDLCPSDSDSDSFISLCPRGTEKKHIYTIYNSWSECSQVIMTFDIGCRYWISSSLFQKQITNDIMVPTDHDIPFSRTFQGLLRYIFKEFSRTFLCSFKYPFAKKWSTMDIQRPFDLWVSQKYGGGVTFFRWFAVLWL